MFETTIDSVFILFDCGRKRYIGIIGHFAFFWFLQSVYRENSRSITIEKFLLFKQVKKIFFLPGLWYWYLVRDPCFDVHCTDSSHETPRDVCDVVHVVEDNTKAGVGPPVCCLLSNTMKRSEFQLGGSPAVQISTTKKGEVIITNNARRENKKTKETIDKSASQTLLLWACFGVVAINFGKFSPTKTLCCSEK